jgi:hypothetical protein
VVKALNFLIYSKDDDLGLNQLQQNQIKKNFHDVVNARIGYANQALGCTSAHENRNR